MNCPAILTPILLLAAIAPAVATAQTPPPRAERQELSLAWKVAWQIALDRVGISPGVIDGKPGPKTRLATREFQRVRGLDQTGRLDAATARLLGVDPNRAATWHLISPEDKGRVGIVPAGWIAKSQASWLPYRSLLELVAERYHCSRTLLKTMNPGVDLDRLGVGHRLIVPLIEHDRIAATPADRLEIDTEGKVIRALSGEKLVGLFHCSVAKSRTKLPTRPARVIGVTLNPTYRFDPAMWPEVQGIDRVLIIPPGPRNPVGLCWIGLSLPGYGIHGTPAPEMIGKTGSHGCFRLTNWDAIRLGKMVKAGTPVTFHRGGR